MATSGDEDVDATAVEYVLNDDTESETRSVSLKDGGKVVVTAGKTSRYSYISFIEEMRLDEFGADAVCTSGTYQTPKILELSGESVIIELPAVDKGLEKA